MGRVKVILLVLGGYIFSVQLVSQYNVLYANALGASGLDIAFLSCISALTMGIASPFIGLAIERYSINKIMFFGFICDIIAMTIFIFATSWQMLIPGFILYTQIVRQMPIADIVIITYRKPNERATTIGLSRVFWTIIGVFASLTAAMMVTYCGGINVSGIRPLYPISIISLLASIFILYKGLEKTTLYGKAMNTSLATKDVSFREHTLSFFTIKMLGDGY